jgi:hypothetical protein
MSRPGADPRGFVSLPFFLLLVLLAIPLVSLVDLLREDWVLARKDVIGGKASGLAEVAFWRWLARAAGGAEGFAPADPLAPEPAWESPGEGGTLAGGAFLATARLRADREDLDTDPTTAVVRHDRSFGFRASPHARGGYPVLDVACLGRIGRHTSRLVVGLTLTGVSPPPSGAVLAAGPLLLSGPLAFDGRPHDRQGNPSPGGIPAVAAPRVEIVSPDVVLTHGTGEDPEGGDVAALLADPYRALGLPADSRYLDRGWVSRGGSPPFSGFTIFSDGYAGQVEGSGVLLIHNPRYDPVRHLASWRRAEGLPSPGYDHTYDHLDPANRPAPLQITGEGCFRGVVAADTILPGSGRLVILGQMLILDPQPSTPAAEGGLTVLYSPDSIRAHAHGRWDTIVDWRPSPALPPP